MAKWDLDVYGVGRYGPGVPVPFLPDITSGANLPGGPLGVRAKCIDPDRVQVRWNLPPQPVFTLLRLVRSVVGPPAWADDGEVLIDAPMGYAVSYLDDGLDGNRRYYYAVYVFDSEVQQWIRGGFSDAMTPDATYDTGGRLFRLIPPYYQDADAAGQLRRFLGLLGFELDILRTEIAGLPDVWDMNRGNAIAVPLLLQQFGIRPEPELGYGNQRALLRNITMLFGSKGSAECLRGLASSVTGWAAQVVDGTNLLPDNQDAQQDGSVGNWTAVSGCTLGYHVGDGSINSPYGVGTLQVISTAVGTMVVALDQNSATELAPVQAGSRYGVSLYARGIARPVSIRVDWYGIRGDYLSSSPYGAPVTPNIADWTTRPTVFATAPADAWWAGVSCQVTGVSAGSVMWLNGVSVAQVSDGSVPPPYQPARDARITVFADLVNEVRNPRLATGTTWWSTAVLNDVAAGAVLTAGTDDNPPPLDESFYGQFVASAGGQGVWTACPNLVPGALYSAGIWVKVVGGTGRVRLVLRDTDSDAPLVATSSVAVGNGDGWVELNVGLVSSGSSPDYQVSLVADGGCTARFGAAMLVRGPEDTPYFDGTIATPTADYMWEGPADGSRSHFYRNRTTRSYRFRKLLPRFIPTARTATLLFAQPVGVTGPGDALYPDATTFPGYDVYPGGPSQTALFPGPSTFPAYDEFPQE